MNLDPRTTAIYLDQDTHKPFWSYDTSGDDEADRFNKLTKTKTRKPVANLHNVDIWKSTLPQGEVFWAAKDKKLIYEADVKFPTMTLNGQQHKVPYQSSVWRDQEHPETAGIPSTVFWQLFLTCTAKMIASDIKQSREGKAFWQYRVKEAFARNLNVTICVLGDHSTPGSRRVVRTVPVGAMKDLRNAYSTDYGRGTQSFLLIHRRATSATAEVVPSSNEPQQGA